MDIDDWYNFFVVRCNRLKLETQELRQEIAHLEIKHEELERKHEELKKHFKALGGRVFEE